MDTAAHREYKLNECVADLSAIHSALVFVRYEPKADSRCLCRCKFVLQTSFFYERTLRDEVEAALVNCFSFTAELAAHVRVYWYPPPPHHDHLDDGCTDGERPADFQVVQVQKHGKRAKVYTLLLAVDYYYSLGSDPDTGRNILAWTSHISHLLSVAVLTHEQRFFFNRWLESSSSRTHVTREKSPVDASNPSPAVKKSCISPSESHDALQRARSLRLCLLGSILAAAVTPFLQSCVTDLKSRQAKYVRAY